MTHSFAAAYDATAALQVENLACRFGLRPVFSGLSFTLAAGGARAITGVNGAGKTSLLRLVAGLAQPDAGRITLSGATGNLKHHTHYIGHADGLKADLSVAETLRFETALAGRGNDEAALADALGLAAHMTVQRVGDLSAGQRRRLGVARLLAAPRQIWLLDEPMAALDKAGRAWMERLAATHLAGGGMIVAATHEALSFAPDTLSLDGHAT